MYDLALIVAVIVALNEVIKRVFDINHKYLPLTALIFGVIASVLYVDGGVDHKIFTGVVMGLTASGLFDQSKIIKGDD